METDARQAFANLARRALPLPVIAIATLAGICFMFIVGLMGAGIGGKAYADSCGSRGKPEVDLGDVDDSPQKPSSGSKLRKKQIANAKIIDGIARDGGLPGRATLIALMTALQESTLLNLDHGHLDSVGLFQQRPKAGWGTKEQIMNPKYAAKMFFFGDGDGSPRGLTDVKGWTTMKLGKAAQAVQHSAYPELYDGQEDAARQIADQADIDLDRSGSQDGAHGAQVDGETPATPDACYDDEGTGASKPSKPGQAFHDGKDTATGDGSWYPIVRNGRYTSEAIEWAKKEAETGGRDWYRACLAFVANAYGWHYSGVPYAIDHYKEMPAHLKHDKDRNPPPGALLYWDTGKRAGHVALYIGDGKIASNDIKRPGYI
ncbi:peptidase M23, partial [Streptomyces sp. MCAF7]